MKFKAAILAECKKPLIIDEISLVNRLKAGQVLVKLEYSGICGKQVEEYLGKMGEDKFLPHLLGHEGYGEVVDFHSSVKRFKAGDKVVMHWVKGEGINSDTPEYIWGGRPLNAGWITTFNEFAVISENRLTLLDAGDDGDVACLLGCAVTTGVGAVINEASTRPYHSVAVIGCGGVGLNCLSGARLVNAQKIDAFDIGMRPLNSALASGAHQYFQVGSPDIKEAYDKVFVTAPYGKAIEYATEICRDGGDIYVIGVPAPTEFSQISALKLHRNVSIHGGNGGGIIPPRDIPLYFSFFKKGMLDVRGNISEVVDIFDINKSINELISGEVRGRHIIKF